MSHNPKFYKNFEERDKVLKALDALRGDDHDYTNAVEMFAEETGITKRRLYYWLRLRETARGVSNSRKPQKRFLTKRKLLTKADMRQIIHLGAIAFGATKKKSAFREIGLKFGISQSHAYEIYCMRNKILGHDEDRGSDDDVIKITDSDVKHGEFSRSLLHCQSFLDPTSTSSTRHLSPAVAPIETNTLRMSYASSTSKAGSSSYEIFAQKMARNAIDKNCSLPFYVPLNQWKYNLCLPTVCCD